MPFQRKRFRIEEMIGERGAAPEPMHPARNAEMPSGAEILRKLMGPHKEAMLLRDEIDFIDRAIRETKREMAALSERGIDGRSMLRVAHELDAVVAGTEQATLRILDATEDIEQTANSLSASLKSDHEQGMAEDIQDRATTIFEACNFQDLTGQRIGKVVQTLKLIETHIGRMSEIWRQIERQQHGERGPAVGPAGESLINGPMLPGDDGHSSQAEIDAMFT